MGGARSRKGIRMNPVSKLDESLSNPKSKDPHLLHTVFLHCSKCTIPFQKIHIWTVDLVEGPKHPKECESKMELNSADNSFK